MEKVTAQIAKQFADAFDIPEIPGLIEIMESKIHGMDQWDDCVRAMESGQKTEITEEVFWYFLEVLPPVFMGRMIRFADGEIVRASFGFAEGAEPITVFWQVGSRFYCRQTEDINKF